jgi:hypothetical protein
MAQPGGLAMAMEQTAQHFVTECTIDIHPLGPIFTLYLGMHVVVY